MSLTCAVLSIPLLAAGAGGATVPSALWTNIQQSREQTFRIWIFFADRDIASAAERNRLIESRRKEISPRALARRLARGTSPEPVSIDDLAVSPGYIHSVLATGARKRQESRWLNAISVEATGDRIQAIAALPFVMRIQPVARAVRRPRPSEQPAPGPDSSLRDNGAAWYSNSFTQLNQINIVSAHNAGYTGQGIVVGILDSGFNRTHAAFNQTTNGSHPVQIVAEHDYVSNDGDTSQQPGDFPNQSAHGTYILGTLGAFYPTVLVGGAFDAAFILAKTEDISQEVPAEEDNYVAGLEWIESLGADMATSSLGYIDWYTQADLDGHTAVTTVAVNMATALGMACCTAAGNEGHDSNPATSDLIAPADALQVLSCGAVDSSNLIASFSSDGPTADGRVKPEVLAQGVNTNTVSFSSNTDIVAVSGTSLSTPLVASGVALIIQAHPTWTVDKIRRALFQTAGDFMANSNYDHTYVRGYGLINIMAAIQFVHGDINGDGVADGRDIQPFVSAFLGTNASASQRRRADCDASGAVTIGDVPIFVSDLLGQ